MSLIYGLTRPHGPMNPVAAQALGRVTVAVIDNLDECVTDRCGSFVARRLLAVGAGRAVAPAQGRKPKPSELFDDDDQAPEQPQVQHSLLADTTLAHAVSSCRRRRGGVLMLQDTASLRVPQLLGPKLSHVPQAKVHLLQHE
jgi:hypothetical protein